MREGGREGESRKGRGGGEIGEAGREGEREGEARRDGGREGEARKGRRKWRSREGG